jgi:hypothetical protein
MHQNRVVRRCTLERVVTPVLRRGCAGSSCPGRAAPGPGRDPQVRALAESREGALRHREVAPAHRRHRLGASRPHPQGRRLAGQSLAHLPSASLLVAGVERLADEGGRRRPAPLRRLPGALHSCESRWGSGCPRDPVPACPAHGPSTSVAPRRQPAGCRAPTTESVAWRISSRTVAHAGAVRRTGSGSRSASSK